MTGRGPVSAAGACALLCLGFGVTPAVADPSVTVVDLPFRIREFRGPDSRAATLAATTDALRDERTLAGRPLVLVWGESGGAALALSGPDLVRTPLRRGPGDLTRSEGGPDAIPDGRSVASGALTVSLVDPTRANPNDALGAAVHAGALLIVERRPVEPGPDPKAVPNTRTRVPAGPGAVFEDREPRLADLDGDGLPEIVTVRSYPDRGSALAVVGRKGSGWAVLAETPPAGEPPRWLNPAGIADFAGAGRPQIAAVQAPHGNGLLQLWSYRDRALTKLAEKPGYANHVAGQAAQGLAATVILAGKTRPALLLPVLDRTALALLEVENGAFVERWRLALPAKASFGIGALGTGRNIHVLVGLEDGRLADVRP